MRNILLCLAAIVTACVAQDLGRVENFRVNDFGSGSITVCWDLTAGDADYPLHKYSLIIDSDLTSEFKCTDPSCCKTTYDLESCMEHTFDLKPIFYTPSGDDIDGEVATTTGYTEDEIPGSVSNIHVVNDTDAFLMLEWNPPSQNSKCASSYTVCFRQLGEIAKHCVDSNDTQATVVGLGACTTYYVDVTPVTPSNSLGETATIMFEAHLGVPGEPQDVAVGLITEFTIQLLWNHPIVNPLCVDRYVLTIGEKHTTFLRSSKENSTEGYENVFTFEPLYPCGDFVIEVSSANILEETSEKVTRFASTVESDPLAPPSVIVTPNGPDSIQVNWGENENDRCSGSFEVCWNDGVHPIEQCQTVEGGGDNALTIYDLVPCSDYNVIVSVQSPNGTFVSNSTTNSTSTADVQPGPVVDLKFTSIETHQLSISYEPPQRDAQCVKEIITRITDNNQRLRWMKTAKNVFEETITGLDACTDYTVHVSTVSPTGLESLVEEITEKTLGDTPSEPQTLGANDVTTTSISLQWFQPATNPRCVTDYILTWSDTVSNSTVNVSASTFKVEYTVDGLTACTTYYFGLIANSPDGVSGETTLTQDTACS